MSRVPRWVFVLAAVVFVGLGVWSLTDRNWSGGIVSALLAVACGADAARGTTARS
jgi:hypothetical protein